MPPHPTPFASLSVPVPSSSLAPPGFLLPAPPSASFLPTSSTSSSGSLSSHAPPVPPPLSYPGFGGCAWVGCGCPFLFWGSFFPPLFVHYFRIWRSHIRCLAACYCFPDDEHIPLDRSAPPLLLESALSEYRRMIEYVCGLFPHAAGVPLVVPPPRALFESFFAPVAPASQSLVFDWFEQVRTALVEVDAGVAGLLASGCPEHLMLPQRLATYTIRGECASGRAVPVNESLLAHFKRPLRPSSHLVLMVRDAMDLEASFCAQSEALSYSMWVLSGLLGFVCLQGFTLADPALFNQLVAAL